MGIAIKKVETFIEITQVGLQTAITNSTLKTGSWYLITDYQTVKYINGTQTSFTGNVEQIFVQATSANSVAPEGLSKTYPDEIIYFNSDVKTYMGFKYTWYDSGNTDPTYPITILSSSTFSVANMNLPETSTWGEFVIFCEDYVTGENFYYELVDLGTGWSFDETTQTFTILNLNGCDLTNPCCLEFEVSAPSGVCTKGLITARENPAKQVFIADDYRGVKVRRYKTSEPAWTAGTYNLGDAVTYSGYVFGALKTTTATPSTGSKDWVRAFVDEYVMMRRSYNINGIRINYNYADYQDYYMFDLADYDANSDVLNLTLHSSDTDMYTVLDVYFSNGVVESRHSELIIDSLTVTNLIDRSVCKYISDSILYYVANCNLGDMQKVLSNDLEDSKFTVVSDSIIYTFINNVVGKMDKNIFRNHTTYNSMEFVSECIFTDVVYSNNIIAMYNCDFFDNVEDNLVMNMYACTFNGDFMNNTCLGEFYQTTFISDCLNNFFKDQCYYNSFYYVSSNYFGGAVYRNNLVGSINVVNNTFMKGFGYNVLTNSNSRFDSNTFLGVVDSWSGSARIDLYNNTFMGASIGNQALGNRTIRVEDNIFNAFGVSSHGNKIGQNAITQTNIKGNNFTGEIIDCEFKRGDFQRNSGKDMDDNIFGRASYTCTFEDNTLGSSFNDNTFAVTKDLLFKFNTCKSGFANNTIDTSEVSNVTFKYDGVTLTYDLKDIDINYPQGHISQTISNTTASATDLTTSIYLTANTAVTTINLPKANGTGKTLIIKAMDISNSCIVNATVNGGTLDGNNTYTFTTVNESITVQDRDVNLWVIVSKYEG